MRAVLLQSKFSGGAFQAFGSKQANVPHAHFVLRTKQLTHPRRAFCAPRKTALKTQNRSRDPHHAPKSVAYFAPRTAQIILIVFSDDMCVRKNSSHGARVAAALRAARHEAQCIPLKKRGRRRPPAGKTVKLKILGTGMISVMPVPLLAVHPRECSPQGRTRYVPSVCACHWTCPVHPHRPPSQAL